MNKILVILFVLISLNIKAQSNDCLECIYKLYSTQNNYNFLKLNTMNGQIWQVQWSTKSNERFTTSLSSTDYVVDDKYVNGRFELIPTINMYNFILLDKITGTTWQVQWSINKEDRMVIMIH